MPAQVSTGGFGSVNAVIWLYSFSNGSLDLWLVSGGEDTTVQVWNLTGKLITRYTGHTRPIRSLVSRPSATDLRVASASEDGTV